MAKSQKDSITILLGLKGYEVEGLSEDEQAIAVEVRGGLKRDSCPCCGGSDVYGHGRSKPRKMLHSWKMGKRVYLELRRKRWR